MESIQLMDEKSRQVLKEINNSHVDAIIDKYAAICKPSSIRILRDSEQDLKFVRDLSIKNGEEHNLKTDGHTYHFDGYEDQGRDLKNTRVMLPKGKVLSKYIETIDKDEALNEIMPMLDGIMEGKEMIVKFYCLGPEHSKFSIPALQMTDSAYVLHSTDLLYRQGFAAFKELKGSEKFFHFVHSAGEIVNGVTKNIDRRRVYIDLEEERVFTINNQYAGNSVGLKKLALRLAISKANKEDWLCEHMFLMGVNNKGRTTYFTGAFPSACGKTSTAMVPGQSIVGDDIAYIRPDEKGFARAVNVEQGIFGIIEDVNPVDDPLIYKALTTPRELIFSNVLINDGEPYWLGMGREQPESGVNFSGEWHEGKKDANGKDILLAHKNARYTIRMSELENVDPNLNNPQGVVVRGFIYGGRDSDTSVPVSQSLSWAHGVFLGAIIESETTATSIGALGVRKHNPMSNIEFLTVPLGVYISNHLKFGEDLDKPPLVFSTNYFLKEDGKFLNKKTDKKVWLLWMEGRVHEEYGAIETPIGFIPKYEDLKTLFKEIFDKEYSKAEYELQFSIRVKNTLERLDRVEKIFREEQGIPELFYKHLDQQRQRLKDAQEKYKKDVLSPSSFE